MPKILKKDKINMKYKKNFKVIFFFWISIYFICGSIQSRYFLSSS